MSEIIFGTPEHIAGLSRKALEEDFRWVNDRRMELEGECERLDAENAKLRELVVEVFKCARRGAACETCKVNNDGYACVYIMRELGVEGIE